MPRSPFLHGLSLTIRKPRALFWTYFLNLSLAWLMGFGIRSQYSVVTQSSLAAQRLIGGFDLGVLIDATRRIGEGPEGPVAASMLGVPLYVLLYFLLVPGTLYAYQTDEKLKLSGLVQRGVESFWSFVRILLLTALVAVPVLGLASAVQAAWSHFLDERMPGEEGFLLRLAGGFVVFLLLCLIRLYFDLVEVHTVAASMTLRPNGKPDRRIRKALRPAWHTFCAHFGSTYLLFVALALAGGVAVYLFGLSALHHLGQPRAWPTLVLAQVGLFLMLFTRFWQRAAETVLARNVFPPERRSPVFAPRTDLSTSPAPPPHPVIDPVPDPEPSVPSLEAPDPGVFHHEVVPAHALTHEDEYLVKNPPGDLVD
jgi:hypothetical protein